MNLLTKSDEDVKTFSTKILSQLIEAGNEKNWEQFSSFFIAEGSSPEAKKDVTNQWETNPVLTTFSQQFHFLGVLRRTDHIITLWKMQSTTTPEDVLGFLAFKEVNNEFKVLGYRIK